MGIRKKSLRAASWQVVLRLSPRFHLLWKPCCASYHFSMQNWAVWKMDVSIKSVANTTALPLVGLQRRTYKKLQIWHTASAQFALVKLPCRAPSSIHFPLWCEILSRLRLFVCRSFMFPLLKLHHTKKLLGDKKHQSSPNSRTRLIAGYYQLFGTLNGKYVWPLSAFFAVHTACRPDSAEPIHAHEIGLVNRPKRFIVLGEQ